VSLRVQALEHLGKHLHRRLDLKQEIQIIEAPPSKAAVYPACAIVLDNTDFALRDDQIPIGTDGQPILGADATLASAQIPADWGRFDDSTPIYNAGRYVSHCRIFVATRLPEQRAELEEEVHRIFLEDDTAPGRILMTMNQPRVGKRTLPWNWPCVAILPDGADVQGSQWTPEYVFAERLWSWIKCDVEVDILVPRKYPINQILQLLMTTQVGIGGQQTSETYDVDQAGDLTPPS